MSVQSVIEKSTEQTATPFVYKAEKAVEKADDIAKFQVAMQKNDTGTENSVVKSEAVSNVQTIEVSAQPPQASCGRNADKPCLGDSILEGLSNMKQGHDSQLDIVKSTLNQEGFTIQDVMKLQVELAKLHLQEDMVSKIASKTTQNIDTLFKSQ